MSKESEDEAITKGSSLWILSRICSAFKGLNLFVMSFNSPSKSNTEKSNYKKKIKFKT